MPLEVLTRLLYGSEGLRRYDLSVGTVLPDKFFSPKERESYLKRKLIRETDKKPNLPSEAGEEIEQLADLSTLKLVEAKEFLEDEYDVAKLEKYFDQESSQKSPRKGLLKWINKKSDELTGFESARVR